MVFVNILKIFKFADLLERKYCQREMMAESFKACFICFFFFLRMFENFCLVCDKAHSFFCIFSVISCTMVFLFVAWIGVLFKINTVFTNSLIYWNQNSIARRKIWHKFLCLTPYRLFLKQEACVSHFFCPCRKILSTVLYFPLFCEVNEKQFHWITFNEKWLYWIVKIQMEDWSWPFYKVFFKSIQTEKVGRDRSSW